MLKRIAAKFAVLAVSLGCLGGIGAGVAQAGLGNGYSMSTNVVRQGAYIYGTSYLSGSGGDFWGESCMQVQTAGGGWVNISGTCVVYPSYAAPTYLPSGWVQFVGHTYRAWAEMYNYNNGAEQIQTSSNWVG